MTKTSSSMLLPLGTIATEFSLLDVISNQQIGLKLSSPFAATIIMFICNHCPYVRHINQGIIKLSNDYRQEGVQFFAINSNDIKNYPDDSPENMKKIAIKEGYQFPYLFDSTQEVARAFSAACTPDFYLFDKDFKLVYRGQFDDSRPGNLIPVTGESLRKVLDCLLANQPINEIQKPSLGCNIKWFST